MSGWPLSWIELAVAATFLGAPWVARSGSGDTGRNRAVGIASLSLLVTTLAWVDQGWIGAFSDGGGVRLLSRLFGEGAFRIGALNASLLVLVSLVQFAIVLATLRTKIRRFSFARNLTLQGLLLLTFCAHDPWAVIVLLLATSVLPGIELRTRRKPIGAYAWHLAVSGVLLVFGQALIATAEDGWGRTLGFVGLALGVGIRSGLVPGHCWVADLFEKGALGTVLLAITPLPGAHAALRLLVPEAPALVLSGLAAMALVTALHAAALSFVQTDARRFLSCVLVSHGALVLVGISLSTALTLSGALCLWLSVVLALGGLGLTLRSLEARTGRLSIRGYLGLATQTPILAGFFLVTGLAAVGFPGTIGFFGVEMLVAGVDQVGVVWGVVVLASCALNGIAVLRAYGRLFLGTRHPGTIDLSCRRAELVAMLALAILLVGGVAWPGPAVSSRADAARELLTQRSERLTAFAP